LIFSTQLPYAKKWIFLFETSTYTQVLHTSHNNIEFPDNRRCKVIIRLVTLAAHSAAAAFAESGKGGRSPLGHESDIRGKTSVRNFETLQSFPYFPPPFRNHFYTGQQPEIVPQRKTE